LEDELTPHALKACHRVRGHQTCCLGPHAIHVVGGPTLIELNIAAFGPSELCEFLPQRPSAAFVFGIAFGIGHHNSDAPHADGGLLGARDEWPTCRCASDKSDEIAPPHGLTLTLRITN
jgi:hypothetical protein